MLRMAAALVLQISFLQQIVILFVRHLQSRKGTGCISFGNKRLQPAQGFGLFPALSFENNHTGYARITFQRTAQFYLSFGIQISQIFYMPCNYSFCNPGLRLFPFYHHYVQPFFHVFTSCFIIDSVSFGHKQHEELTWNYV